MDDSFSTSFGASEAVVAAEHDGDNNNDHEPQHVHPLEAAADLPENDAAAHNNTGRNNQQQQRVSAVTSMVAFLCMEADMAEERARRLRHQAKTLVEQFGLNLSDIPAAAAISDTNQQQHHLYHPPQDEMAPLDEHGNPKYKGKKRGRKPKPRKRRMKPGREKRKHTGYTLFVQENHPLVKAEFSNHPNNTIANSEVVSIVAKRWRDLTKEQQQEWKERAVATHNDNGSSSNPLGGGKPQESHAMENGMNENDGDDHSEGEFEDAEDDLDHAEDEDIDPPVPPARKRSRIRTK